MAPILTGQWRIQDFPEGGAWTLQGGHEHAKFSRKLHEIERIWTPRGGRASLTPPPRSANAGSWPLQYILHKIPKYRGKLEYNLDLLFLLFARHYSSSHLKKVPNKILKNLTDAR